MIENAKNSKSRVDGAAFLVFGAFRSGCMVGVNLDHNTESKSF